MCSLCNGYLDFPKSLHFVAWTVNLHHEGNLLAFVLDIIEFLKVSLFVCVMYVDFVHHLFSLIQKKFLHIEHKLTNKVSEFHINMSRIEYYCVILYKDQILAFNGDNATSNDKQTEFLNGYPNSFEIINLVQCFNYTLQFSVTASLKLFGASAKVTDNSGNDNEDHEGGAEKFSEDLDDGDPHITP